MKKSAGIIPFREIVSAEGKRELEFFVGRPWKTSDYAAFLKGGMEAGEEIDETAVREFTEESGVSLEKCDSSMLIPLGWVRQNSSKDVFAFGLHFPNINPEECHSNLCPSGKPEIVKYEWVTYDELKDRTCRKHLVFYQKLMELNETRK